MQCDDKGNMIGTSKRTLQIDYKILQLVTLSGDEYDHDDQLLRLYLQIRVIQTRQIYLPVEPEGEP